MKIEFKKLNNVQTQLLTWGNPFICNGSDIIICVTGNPGVSEFYTEFGSELHKNTGFPVCVIGHAGHSFIPNEDSDKLTGREHLFNLNGQLKHKLDLIDLLDKNSRLHLIGHSIGAWFVVEALQKYDNLFSRVSSVNLIFPTLQKMAVTNNGKFLNGIIRNLSTFILFFVMLLSFLPTSICTFLVSLVYINYNSLQTYHSKRIVKLLHPKILENILFLGFDEMDNVHNLNTEGVDKIKHFTNVIYSCRDGWAPTHYMTDLKPFSPPLQMREVDICHAFIFKSSERVAGMVSEFIKTKV